MKIPHPALRATFSRWEKGCTTGFLAQPEIFIAIPRAGDSSPIEPARVRSQVVDRLDTGVKYGTGSK